MPCKLASACTLMKVSTNKLNMQPLSQKIEEHQWLFFTISWEKKLWCYLYYYLYSKGSEQGPHPTVCSLLPGCSLFYTGLRNGQVYVHAHAQSSTCTSGGSLLVKLYSCEWRTLVHEAPFAQNASARVCVELHVQVQGPTAHEVPLAWALVCM